MKRTWGLFLYAVLAGFSIGIGGTVFLRLKDAFPGGNVVGALLFTIGLFTVCTRGYALFTGKSCYLFDNPWPAYLGDLAVFWVGNLLGAMLIAWLESLTGLVGAESGINVTAAALVGGKMSATYLGLFVLGILCNICISMRWGSTWRCFWVCPSLSCAARSIVWRICTTGPFPASCMTSRGNRSFAFWSSPWATWWGACSSRCWKSGRPNWMEQRLPESDFLKHSKTRRTWECSAGLVSYGEKRSQRMKWECSQASISRIRLTISTALRAQS